MTSDSQYSCPNYLAAVLYRSDDDVDMLLADFAISLVQQGVRVGGVVQRNLKHGDGRSAGMLVIDLLSEREISICQSLGTGAIACKLDPAGLAEASLAVSHSIAEGAELIVVNKFSKQEASGHGLRNELADAILAGGPVLTAVPEKCLDAWNEFTGTRGAILPCTRDALEVWWRDVSTATERTMEKAVSALSIPATASSRSPA